MLCNTFSYYGTLTEKHLRNIEMVHLARQAPAEWTQYLAQARDLFIECREKLEPLVMHRFSIQNAGPA